MKLKLGYIYLEIYTVMELSNKGIYRRLSQKIQDRMFNQFAYTKLLVGRTGVYENMKVKKLI